MELGLERKLEGVGSKITQHVNYTVNGLTVVCSLICKGFGER
jgi:hypothetical protein